MGVCQETQSRGAVPQNSLGAHTEVRQRKSHLLGSQHGPCGLQRPLRSLPDGVTWDGLVGPCAEDLFDRVTVDGELLPARPICLCGLHIHKGLLVDRHNLQGKHKCPLVSIPLQSYLLPGGERDLLPVLPPASGHQLFRDFLSPALQLSAHLPCISLFNLLLNTFPSALCIGQQQRAPELNHMLVKGSHLGQRIPSFYLLQTTAVCLLAPKP